jgi:hypothetical protein
MQGALTSLPTPEAQTLAVGVLCLLAGMAVPTRYGMERVEGFGRFVVSKFPYKAPPGRDEETAMQEAVDGDQPAQEGEQ